jgi:hypothetical protein
VFSKSSVVNANGNNEASLTIFIRFFPSTIIKSIFPTNSNYTCLQAPHGDVNLGLSEAIAIAANFFTPSEIALKAAVRSAQIVNPKELFSILQPVKTVPSFVSSATPTRNLEYGA